MRRVSYKSVLSQSGALFNGDTEPAGTDAALFNIFINRWAREYWNRFFWPEWLVTEKRYFRAFYDAAATYSAGAEVYYPTTCKYYLCLASTTGLAPAATDGTTNYTKWVDAPPDLTADYWVTGHAYALGDKIYNRVDDTYYSCISAHTSSTAPPNGNWGALQVFVRSISLTQAGKTVIDTVKKIYNRDPRVDVSAWPHNFDLREEGVIIPTCVSPSVWVQFRRAAPSWAGDIFSAGVVYTADTQVYWTDGDFYKCQATTTAGQSPATTAAKWQRLDFPVVLSHAVAQAAYAEKLEDDGQQDKSVGALQKAEGLLRRQFDIVERQQGQAGQLNVMGR